MKTYEKTVSSPMLVIKYEDGATSPREFDSNLGYFITCEKHHNSPDSNEELISLIQNLSEESENSEEHIAKIKEEMPQNGFGNVLYIIPVYRYEHGNVVYKRGTAQGFDYSNCGFYIVTDKTAKQYETETDDVSYYNKVIDSELEIYTAWANGEVYEYTLYDEDGLEIDAGSGFYSVEEIRGNLGNEWKRENLEQYLVS